MHLSGFLCAAILLAGCISTFANNFRAGVARAEITAPIGYRMAGYFHERLSTATRDPLWAKTIVMDDGKQKLALVSCDLVGMSLNISTNARGVASARTGIPVSNILIASTHTHTAPLFEGVIRDYLHGESVREHGKDIREEIDYPKFLIEQIVKSIVQANANLRQAELQIGIAEQNGLAFNRRYHMKNGRVAFNPGQLNTNIVKAAGPTDPDVGIWLVRDKSRKPFGGLTVFAMHADTLGGTEYSADYPFHLEETLQKEIGTGFVSLFAAGTCGDINHIDVSTNTPVKGPEVTERLGTTLGRTVLREMPQLRTVKKPLLLAKSATIQGPLQTVTPEQVAEARQKLELLRDERSSFFAKVEAVKALDIASKGSHVPLEVQVFRLDAETAVVGLPCEIFVELGLAIKKASPFKNTMVISIANDRPSYVPTRKAFAEGSYEVTNARVKPETGEMLVETAIKLLQEAR